VAKFLWNLYGLGEYVKIYVYILKKSSEIQLENVTFPIRSYCSHWFFFPLKKSYMVDLKDHTEITLSRNVYIIIFQKF